MAHNLPPPREVDGLTLRQAAGTRDRPLWVDWALMCGCRHPLDPKGPGGQSRSAPRRLPGGEKWAEEQPAEAPMAISWAQSPHETLKTHSSRSIRLPSGGGSRLGHADQGADRGDPASLPHPRGARPPAGPTRPINKGHAPHWLVGVSVSCPLGGTCPSLLPTCGYIRGVQTRPTASQAAGHGPSAGRGAESWEDCSRVRWSPGEPGRTQPEGGHEDSAVGTCASPGAHRGSQERLRPRGHTACTPSPTESGCGPHRPPCKVGGQRDLGGTEGKRP